MLPSSLKIVTGFYSSVILFSNDGNFDNFCLLKNNFGFF